MKILCVEDDEGLAVLLEKALAKQHYQVDLAADGLTAWDLTELDTYDLILLDWILPDLNGIEFCQRLRSEKLSAVNPNRDTPILLMTALDAVTNKVIGLNAGADDYVVKPFNLDELLARIRALLRRSQGVRTPLLEWGELCFNPNSCEVTYQAQPIVLAAKEYELLELFLRNPDHIFSLNRLLTALWKVDEMPGEGTVRAHIKGLRQKLKQAGVGDPIETLYKLGYRLKPYAVCESDKTDGLEKSVETKKSFSSKSPVSSVPSELWEGWQRVRPAYLDRLSSIEQAVTAIQQQSLTPEEKHLAERHAHTLIGSLGSFGLEEGSHIARQIQQILKQPESIESSEIEILLQLIVALRQQLGGSEIKVTETIEAIASLEVSSNLDCLPDLLASILIVDADLAWGQALSKEAWRWGIQADVVSTFREAQQALQQGKIDALLLDLDCSAGDQNGLEFLATIRHQYPALPVVTFTGEASFEQRLKVTQLGSRCFLKKPMAPAQVLGAIAPLIERSNPSMTGILIVERDPVVLQFLTTLLESEGYQVKGVWEPEQVWRVLDQMAPDILILEMEFYHPSSVQSNLGGAALPAFNGIELCQVIRSDPDWNRLSVVFLSVHPDKESIQRGLTVGADDVLSKPSVAQDVLTCVRTRLEQRSRWGLRHDDSKSGRQDRSNIRGKEL